MMTREQLLANAAQQVLTDLAELAADTILKQVSTPDRHRLVESIEEAIRGRILI